MKEIVSPDPAVQILADVRTYVERHEHSEIHISLTGGRIGSLISQTLVQEFADNPRVHFWFSDERFVPSDSNERNDVGVSNIAKKCHLHRIAGSDRVDTPQQAALDYSAEIHRVLTSRFCSDNTLMDICILSIGPDGHIASLFPHHPSLAQTLGVVAISDSPKPPAQRVTWTYPTINASRQVWLVATGSEKADAVAALRQGADVQSLPAVGAHGKQETRLYTDVNASSLA